VVLVSLLQSSVLSCAFVVAAAGTVWPVLSVQQALGLVLGVNLGAALSRGLAALAHMGKAGEFRRAFSAATAHGVVVVALTLLLWPLDLSLGPLASTTRAAASSVGWLEQELGFNPLPALSSFGSDLLERLSLAIGGGDAAAWLMLFSAAGMIMSFGTARQLLATLTARRAKVYLQRALDAGPCAGALTGAVSAVLLQSAQRTTSVLVPMAGAGLVSGRQVLPIALGANFGVALSAVGAAFAVVDRGVALALQVSFMHLFFNALCVLAICALPKLAAPCVTFAELLAERAVRSKRAAFVWVAVTCYVMPLACWVLFS
jgi:sodium-dependent phosphate cotransporter